LAKENHQESLRKPARRWEDNIKIDFKETVWQNVNWIYLAQDKDQL
jgi:hypothetical protein